MATVDELISALLKFQPSNQVLVRHGAEAMGPNHYTLGVEELGNGEPVIVCTHRVDEPEDLPYEPTIDS